MNVQNVLEAVVKNFIASGAPESVRWDVNSHLHALKSTYCKYRRIASSDNDDHEPRLHVSDTVMPEPGRLQVSVFCTVGPNSRKLMTFNCDLGE